MLRVYELLTLVVAGRGPKFLVVLTVVRVIKIATVMQTRKMLCFFIRSIKPINLTVIFTSRPFKKKKNMF